MGSGAAVGIGSPGFKIIQKEPSAIVRTADMIRGYAPKALLSIQKALFIAFVPVHPRTKLRLFYKSSQLYGKDRLIVHDPFFLFEL